MSALNEEMNPNQQDTQPQAPNPNPEGQEPLTENHITPAQPAPEQQPYRQSVPPSPSPAQPVDDVQTPPPAQPGTGAPVQGYQPVQTPPPVQPGYNAPAQGYQPAQTPPPVQPGYGAPPPLPRVIYQPMEEPPAPPCRGLATASMVLGIVSLVLTCSCCGVWIGWITAIVGLILGIVARARGNRVGTSLAGIITNGAALLLAVILIAYFIMFGSFSYNYYNEPYWDGVHL